MTAPTKRLTHATDAWELGSEIGQGLKSLPKGTLLRKTEKVHKAPQSKVSLDVYEVLEGEHKGMEVYRYNNDFSNMLENI